MRLMCAVKRGAYYARLLGKLPHEDRPLVAQVLPYITGDLLEEDALPLFAQWGSLVRP